MSRLVRLYVVSVAIGFAVAAAFVAALVVFDVARLGHLVTSSPGGWLAAAMLFVFNGLVFAGVQFGIAVMGLADRRGDGGRGLRAAAVSKVVSKAVSEAVSEAAPVPVAAGPARRL